MRSIKNLAILLFLAGLFVACGEPATDQSFTDETLALIRWQVETRRTSYCGRDIDNGNIPFDAEHWRDGDTTTRGAMARELICGDMGYGLLQGELVSMLGAGDTTEDPGISSDELTYRVYRTWDFNEYSPPVPAGYREVPNTYDILVLFDPATKKVIGYDVSPTLESDS